MAPPRGARRLHDQSISSTWPASSVQSSRTWGRSSPSTITRTLRFGAGGAQQHATAVARAAVSAASTAVVEFGTYPIQVDLAVYGAH